MATHSDPPPEKNSYGTTINDGGNLHQGNIYGNVIHKYAEGVERNQYLNELLPINPQNDKAQTEREKGGLFKDVYKWFLGTDYFRHWRDAKEGCLLWIVGYPCTGKTLMLCGLINELLPSTKLSANSSDTLLSFAFFQASEDNQTQPCTTATSVLSRLIYLLVKQQPELMSHVRIKYDTIGSRLFEDTSYWDELSAIFINMLQDPGVHNVYLIIDALDQCDADLDKLLNLITDCETFSAKWLVSSYEDPLIGMKLRRHPFMTKVDLDSRQHTIHVSEAVKTYIDHVIAEIHCAYEDEVVEDLIRKKLNQGTTGTFIWVSHILQDLREAGSSWDVEKIFTQIPDSLRTVYVRMLKRILSTKGDTPGYCGQILATAVTAYEPLTLEELGVLARLPTSISGDARSMLKIVRLCGFFLKQQHDGMVHLIHLSAREFLSGVLSYRKTLDPRSSFWSTINSSHMHLLASCLDVMSTHLRRNMYNLSSPDTSIDSVNKPSPDPLAVLRYSILHWADHVEAAAIQDIAVSKQAISYHHDINRFLRHHLLFWVEALSLCGQLSSALPTLAKAQQYFMYTVSNVYREEDLSENTKRRTRLHRDNRLNSNLKQGTLHLTDINDDSRPSTLTRHSKVIHGGYRMIFAFRHCVAKYPLQIYYAALVLGPAQVRSLFDQKPSWVESTPAESSDWDTLRCCTKLQSDTLTSLAFSPSSEKLAAVCGNSIQVQDSHTTQLLYTLRVSTGSVVACKFIDNEERLLVVSRDGTVQVYCLRADAMPQILYANIAGSVESVAFSTDGQYIAFGYQHGSIVLHKASCKSYGSELQFQESHHLRGHAGTVISVCFSGDSESLVSLTSDHQIKMWNIKQGFHINLSYRHEETTLSRTCTGSPRLVAYSPDNRTIAGGFSDGSVILWEFQKTHRCRILKGHTDSILSMSFSRNGIRLATASKDATVRVWDTKLCLLQQTLCHYKDSIPSVIFSPDDSQLVSGTSDNRIWYWDGVAATSTSTRTTSFIASKKACEIVGRCDLLAIFKSKEELRLATSRGHYMQLWDEELNNVQHELQQEGRDLIKSITFSPTRQAIASGSVDGVVTLWDINTGQRTVSITAHRTWVNRHGTMVCCIAFSLDGKLLASGSSTDGVGGKPVCVWDLETQQEIATFPDHNTQILALGFSDDNQRLVVVNRRRQPNVDDTFTWPIYNYEVTLYDISGERRQYFQADDLTNSVYAMTISPRGELLAVASVDGEVIIWNISTGTYRQRLLIPESIKATGGAPTYPLIAFSPDSRKLAVGSTGYCNIVWLWDQEAEAFCQVFEGHEHRLLAIEFSTDGKRVLSLSRDGVARIWATDAPPMWETELSAATPQLSLQGSEGSYAAQGTRTLDVFNSWGFSEDGYWITWRGQNVFWLPPVYQAMDLTAGENGIIFRSQLKDLAPLYFSREVYL